MDEAQAREGYRAAIQMISHDAKMIWDSFRALLGANTVLVGLAGTVLKAYPEFRSLTIILAGLGIVVAVAWALITARSFAYYHYCFAWARKYESLALGSNMHLIQLGQTFAEGSTVPMEGLDPARLGWTSRLFRVEWLIYVVILAFVVVYVYLLVVAAFPGTGLSIPPAKTP